MTNRVIILKQEDVPEDVQWLARQSCPVIAYGQGATANADVLVTDLDAALALEQRIQAYPLTALVLVQVLRCTELLPVAQALDVESMAYSTLQAGPEFAAWQRSRQQAPALAVDAGDPVLLTRDGAVLEAVLNRPERRNAISVEMRDALVETLTLLDADPTIEQLIIRANGTCFSVGGELQEFGLAPDPATAHWVRAVQSPARLLAEHGDKVSCYLHGACIGSGLELPAFAARVVARKKTFFHLPELQLGLIPGAGGTVSIARRIGRQRTAWMVLSGKRINAELALEWGLIDEIAD